MKYSVIGLAVALGTSSLCLGAETKECKTDTSVHEDIVTTLHIHNSEQLDAFEGCTTLNGHIVIEADYEGDFVLNEVTNLHGNISTVENGTAGLGLFELRDLNEIDHIHLLGLVGDVNLPNLESTGDIELVQMSASGSIDLSSLPEANDVSIRGSWTSTKFGSLKTVTLGTQFCASQDCSIYGPERKFPYIEVDLPLLEKTDYFEVAGAVKSVTVPKLEEVGYIIRQPSVYFPRQGLRINIESTNQTLDFNAPKLHTLNGSLEAYGGLSSLSLGSLGKTTARTMLNTDTPLAFYSTIQTAQYFYVWGKLRSIYLPDMKDLGSVELSYSPRLPCNDTLYLLWETQSSYSSDWENTNSCLGYDFPQENKTTNQGTSTMTATSSSAESTGSVSASSDAFPSDSSSPGSETKSSSNADGTESSTPKSAARLAFSIPWINCSALLTMTVVFLFSF